jgi:putative copper export protein
MVVRTATALIDLAGIFLFLGSLFCIVWVIPHGGLPEHTEFFRRMRRQVTGLLLASLILLVFTTGSLLLVDTATMSGATLAEAYSFIPAVLAKTHFGTVWVVRCATLGLSILFFFISWFRGPLRKAGTQTQRTSQNIAAILLMICAGVFVFTRSAVSHAADGGDFTIREFMDWLHLLVTGTWGGGLIVLSVLLLSSLNVSAKPPFGSLTVIASRFSIAAGLGVFVIILSGTYNAWIELGSLAGFITKPYGRLLSAKIVLVLIVLFIGAYNRYRLLPQLGAGHTNGIGARLARFSSERAPANSEGGLPPAQIEQLLGKKVVIESILVVAILVCTAILVNSIPAREAIL